jgi:hypothetical protein
MAYRADDARREMLEVLAGATDDIGVALAAIGAAYEQIADQRTADRLEEELFRPVQQAYGKARRTHDGFARRHGLPTGTFEQASAGVPSTGVPGFLDVALEAIERADTALAELQDSMRPVEVGDAELRAGLAEVRELVGVLPERTRAFTRTLGR